MARDPIKHFRDNIATRPTLVTAPITEWRDATPAPDHETLIDVELVWTDGHNETGRGFARAWTRTAVLADVHTTRGHYISWVWARQVARRAKPQ
jgi:hypothetical protein